MATKILAAAESKSQLISQAQNPASSANPERDQKRIQNLEKARNAKVQNKKATDSWLAKIKLDDEVHKKTYNEYSEIPIKKRSNDQKCYVRAYDKLQKVKK